MIIATAHLPPTKSEFRYCVGSNPVCGVLEIREGKDLQQWSRIKIKMNAVHRSAIPHKQLIIITHKSIYFVYVIFNNLKNYMWHWSLISLLDKLTILFIAICTEWFQPFQKVIVQLFPRKAYSTGIEKHFIEIKLNIQQKTHEFVNDKFISSLFKN